MRNSGLTCQNEPRAQLARPLPAPIPPDRHYEETGATAEAEAQHQTKIARTAREREAETTIRTSLTALQSMGAGCHRSSVFHPMTTAIAQQRIAHLIGKSELLNRDRSPLQAAQQRCSSVGSQNDSTSQRRAHTQTE